MKPRTHMLAFQLQRPARELTAHFIDYTGALSFARHIRGGLIALPGNWYRWRVELPAKFCGWIDIHVEGDTQHPAAIVPINPKGA